MLLPCALLGRAGDGELGKRSHSLDKRVSKLNHQPQQPAGARGTSLSLWG